MTFGLLYAFSENFVLPLSHDEVVHGKGSLLAKMPGDAWQKFANLRAYYGFMWGHPGKKLLFMGRSSARARSGTTSRAWTGTCSTIGWHQGVQSLVSDLNRALPRRCRRCTSATATAGGFAWIEANDAENSRCSPGCATASRARRSVLVVCNFTPVPRDGYRIGLPAAGRWRERLNTDAAALWRLGHGQSWRRRGGGRALARPALLGDA